MGVGDGPTKVKDYRGDKFSRITFKNFYQFIDNGLNLKIKNKKWGSPVIYARYDVICNDVIFHKMADNFKTAVFGGIMQLTFLILLLL